MRKFGFRIIVSGLAFGFLALTFSAATPAQADGGRHPYFDDRGTLTWYRTYADARSAARRSGKLVFIESGRLRCSQCKKICQNVLPDRAVRNRIAAIAVGCAAECDRPEREVSQLFRRNLPNPRQLPLVAFVTPDGRWVTGFWGGKSARQFMRYLEAAEREWRSMNASRRPAARPHCPAPRPEPAPAPEPTREPAPTPEPAPVREPEPAPEPTVAPDTALTIEADEPCCDGPECECPGGVCTPPPMFNVPDLLGPEAVEPDTHAHVAKAPETAEGNGFPEPTAPALRAPEIRRGPTAVKRTSRGLPAPPKNTPHIAKGDPDASTVQAPTRKVTTSVRPASTNRSSARLKAEKAAARGQWAEVVRLTERRTDDRDLLELNRRAHAWAHDTLQDALGLLEAGKVKQAREQVDIVKREMAGQPEGEDARRGLDAIEFVQDLAYLDQDSLVRRAVARNAYEKMRGSRWAGLFR